ncbi:hypothetical protein EMIHUDRAFT_243305 [Emiliania huxleyi CCMP1516]|uniref:Nucleoside phosphorylase domain-containing protein n=2 Tax=Emiliania huxleyi TaxID=2903 RepID=A0A0D3J6E3_EMIH1|nr:hypothetical protein EMIHUDRAFT_243305 [Emiliania huxleyi CCMP1516]EOD19078.1 hypothetical protein EMIHUDRAFT_243305 [Emiliania huxleyi CCMP1516]|eukprot:XP_005771507.1 hypothetical protein EMIHUDRAFT_243305 [Emiliania huxleyi CCMP1516]
MAAQGFSPDPPRSPWMDAKKTSAAPHAAKPPRWRQLAEGFSLHARWSAGADGGMGATSSVAGLFGVPVLALKTVTDIVDDETPNHETFMANLASASQKLQDAIPELLKFVHGKEASGL